MSFKLTKCPVCDQKITNFWYYLWMPNKTVICPNCKTKIKWHPIVRLYGLIFAIIMVGGFYLLKDYFDPSYIAGIISVIVATVVYILIPKKIKIIKKGGEENKE